MCNIKDILVLCVTIQDVIYYQQQLNAVLCSCFLHNVVFVGHCFFGAVYWGRRPTRVTMFPLSRRSPMSSWSMIARTVSIVLAMSSRLCCWVGRYCKFLQLIPVLLLIAETPAKRRNGESGLVKVVALMLCGSESGAVGPVIVFLLESGSNILWIAGSFKKALQSLWA